MDEEKLIGWIYSGIMGRGRVGGYYIFVTDKRILGTKKGRSLFLDSLPVVSLALESEGGRINNSDAIKIYREIENAKDLEIYKDDVERIVLKKPGWIHSGGLVIKTRKGGQKVNLWRKFGWKTTYRKLESLLSKFFSPLEIEDI